MVSYFLNIHILVVILFLLLFLGKACLLFMNQHARLDKVRASARMLDIVLGVLVVVSGVALLLQYEGSWPRWLLVKVALVVSAVPFALVGIKRHNKVLMGLGLLLFLYVYGVAETKSLKMRPEKEERSTAPAIDKSSAERAKPEVSEPEQSGHPILSQMQETQLENTRAIYTQLCASCHGADGQRGAVNLQMSALDQKARAAVIANGRGVMPGFSATLTAQEIEALALYTTLLKQ